MRKKVGVVRKAFLAVYSTNSFIGLSRLVCLGPTRILFLLVFMVIKEQVVIYQ